MAKLIHIVNSYHISSYCVHGTERKYFFYGLEYVTIYVRSILCEKKEFCKNVKSGSVHYGSCFTMLFYHVIIYKFILYLKN